MNIPLNQYCGDEEMARLLEKAGAMLSISEIFGLFYGCLAAAELVMPSQYHPLIFGEEGAEFESEEEAQKLIGNLMSLWNHLARWNPEEEPFYFPMVRYTDDIESLGKHLRDTHSLVEMFIAGLGLGNVREEDFTEDGLQAVEDMAKNSAIILNYAEVMQREKDSYKSIDNREIENVEQLDEILADCICSINLSLKTARDCFRQERRTMSSPPPASSSKIPRNAPCPCGSGKKYKKCCEIMH